MKLEPKSRLTINKINEKTIEIFFLSKKDNELIKKLPRGVVLSKTSLRDGLVVNIGINPNYDIREVIDFIKNLFEGDIL